MAERTHNDLVNIAFDILGKRPTADIDNERGDELNRRAKARYQGAFDFAMAMAEWPELRKVKVLATAATTPQGEFINAVQLPGDCIKVWLVNQSKRGWKRIGSAGAGLLLTNAAVPLTLIYGRRIDASEMSEYLAQLCGARLAVLLKPHAGLSGAERDGADDAFQAAVRDANFMSGSEDGTDTPLESDWLSAMDGL
jgi:hypothetical protein